MKRVTVLVVVVLLVCAAHNGWSRQVVQQECKEGVLDVLLDIVTAPCALLATCLGLDTTPACIAPTKVKIVKVARKSPTTPRSPESGEKTSPQMRPRTAASEDPKQSDRAMPRQPDPRPAAESVPIQHFTAPEKQTLPQVSQTEAPQTPPGVKALAPERPQTAKKQEPMPKDELKPSARGEAPGKPVPETPKPAVGAVVETVQKTPVPELSPPKVEQTSTQTPDKQTTNPAKSQDKPKKSPKTNHGYPCGPYYQPYPSCGPRFFFR